MFPLGDSATSRGRPVITLLLIIVNVAVFFLWEPAGLWAPAATPLEAARAQAEANAFLYAHAAIPCEILRGTALDRSEVRSDVCSAQPGPPLFAGKHVYAAVIASLFLHGGLVHLLGNMWFLWIFGDNVESTFGRLRYLLLYVTGGIAATAASVVLRGDAVPLIGASGAIAGALGAYLALFPRNRVSALVFYGVWPVPAWLFLGLWFVGQFAIATPGVAWEAHVAGFMLGVVVTLVMRAAGVVPARRTMRA